jgi:hypothetical protein
LPIILSADLLQLAQTVTAHVVSVAAAAPHVAWMEELAGRILQYRQQCLESSSSSSSSSGSSGTSHPLLQHLPSWQALAGDVLALLAALHELHGQCTLLAAEAAATGAGIARVGDRKGGSSSSSSSSTVGGGGGGRPGGSSKKAAKANKAAADGSHIMKWCNAGHDGSIGRGLPAAVALQVQAAWLRPNLLRLMHVWLLQATASDTMADFMVKLARRWVNVQLNPALHPAVVQQGLGDPAVAAAVAAADSTRCKEVQVSSWRVDEHRMRCLTRLHFTCTHKDGMMWWHHRHACPCAASMAQTLTTLPCNAQSQWPFVAEMSPSSVPTCSDGLWLAVTVHVLPLVCAMPCRSWLGAMWLPAMGRSGI